jgi:hypothetical protein
VQDNGPGVPDAMKRIFDRFRAGRIRARGAVGSGLGLSIVKEFVELHGGTVVVVDAPAAARLFQIEIPVRAPAPSCGNRRGQRTPPAMATIRLIAGDAVPAHRAGKPQVLVARRQPPTCVCFSTTC